MRGIVLAGGTGSRLLPITRGMSKQLLPIYDKPLIYYPISTLMLAGIRDILIICTPRDLELFQRLLGTGKQWGIEFTYAAQQKPAGIAEAFIIGESFIRGEKCALVLGDNIFHGPGLGRTLQEMQKKSGAQIFGYQVSNPSDYGVVQFNENGIPIKIVEKPTTYLSDIAVPGLYFYDDDVVEKAKALRPSARNELEITDLNNLYLANNELSITLLPYGTAWLDTGTVESLHEASNYVRILELRQGLKIGCPEEIAWSQGWINDEELRQLANELGNQVSYSSYLNNLLERKP
jgi:glucose-1-phosphate thymidylyltransferase